MLLDYIVDFCNREYQNADTNHVCDNCTHPQGCSGGCAFCLNEVHFPDGDPDGKKEYDCKNILDYYVCRYSHKYCSEVEYALGTVEDLKKLSEFNVMSIGCGATPDLMALECLL